MVLRYICLWTDELSLCQASESVTLPAQQGMWPRPTSLATLWTLLWAPLLLWCFLLFCGACAAPQHLFAFTLEPSAPACKLTFLFQPSCQSVRRAWRSCCLWLILDLLGSTNFWRSATKHGAFSIVGAEKGYVVKSFRFKVNANFCVEVRIHLWDSWKSNIFVAFVYPETRW